MEVPFTPTPPAADDFHSKIGIKNVSYLFLRFYNVTVFVLLLTRQDATRRSSHCLVESPSGTQLAKIEAAKISGEKNAREAAFLISCAFSLKTRTFEALEQYVLLKQTLI